VQRKSGQRLADAVKNSATDPYPPRAAVVMFERGIVPQSVGAEAACGGVKKKDLQKEAGE